MLQSVSSEAPVEPLEKLTHLTVTPWWEPSLAVTGFDVRSAYVERYWLGVLGPSGVFLLRRFARGFDERAEGFRVSLADTAQAIGLGRGIGRNSPICRTIDRACGFGAARRTAPDALSVRTHLPPLTRRQLARLPAPIRASHDAFLAARSPDEPPGPQAA